MKREKAKVVYKFGMGISWAYFRLVPFYIKPNSSNKAEYYRLVGFHFCVAQNMLYFELIFARLWDTSLATFRILTHIFLYLEI
jgi:hypothetical protein